MTTLSRLTRQTLNILTSINTHGRFCKNHPDEEAVTQCLRCYKPICEECVVKVKRRNFCSEFCADAYLSVKTGEKDIKQKNERVLVTTLVLITVVLAICALIYFW